MSGKSYQVWKMSNGNWERYGGLTQNKGEADRLAMECKRKGERVALSTVELK